MSVFIGDLEWPAPPRQPPRPSWIQRKVDAFFMSYASRCAEAMARSRDMAILGEAR